MRQRTEAYDNGCPSQRSSNGSKNRITRGPVLVQVSKLSKINWERVRQRDDPTVERLFARLQNEMTTPSARTNVSRILVNAVAIDRYTVGLTP